MKIGDLGFRRVPLIAIRSCIYQNQVEATVKRDKDLFHVKHLNVWLFFLRILCFVFRKKKNKCVLKFLDCEDSKVHGLKRSNLVRGIEDDLIGCYLSRAIVVFCDGANDVDLAFAVGSCSVFCHDFGIRVIKSINKISFIGRCSPLGTQL
ncbi:hypothetical protein HanRHA438_Chr03g0138601 [Helianthus annuus]|nr:hypothetical protein HanHA300_Chr03g0105831 [Helianthus annuus]KAJ0609221.1 hypothetical protein HanHA89_Chr03g0117501 [Helianthus annuus]KAJ0937124.1 hypothetical protein HanRHA438_Chr03g0138601 [Helianthus annuus]